MYVTDSRGHSHNHNQKGYIYAFQCDGQFCASFGSESLSSAYDVAVSAYNQLLVADFFGNCISIFSLDGQYVNSFSASVSFLSNMSHPNSISTDRNGFIFVADGKYRIIVFDKSGNFIHSFTGLREKRDNSCNNSNYYALAINPDGNVYVLNNLTKKVMIFYDF